MVRRRAFAMVLVVGLTAAAAGPASRDAPASGDHQAPLGYHPDGRIAMGGSGVYIGPRTCAPDCDLEQLTADPTDSDPAWSPTGREIAFTRQVGSDYLLHVLDVSTGIVTRLTQPAGMYTADTDPDWSPDGTTIAFTHSAEPSSPEYENSNHLAFVTYRGPHPGTMRVLPNSAGPHDPCVIWQIGRRDPTFSPDGTAIAYVAYATNTVNFARTTTRGADVDPGLVAQADCPMQGVWTRSLGGSAEYPVAPELGDTLAPAWSPDGSSIALVAPDGPYVVPLQGGPPIPIVDSAGARPTYLTVDGRPVGSIHTGWDPGGTFLLVDISSSDGPRYKYRPDGTGDLDRPNGTHTIGGWSVQCLPADCVTSLTVYKQIDGANGAYPATFDYTGTVAGEIVIDGPPDSDTGSITSKVQPGHASVTEDLNADWPLTSLDCDAPAQVDLAGRTVSLDIESGTVVTCSFFSDIGVPTAPPLLTPLPPLPTAAASHGPCDGAYTTGNATAMNLPEYLTFAMSARWCHDGRRATLPGGDPSVSLVTGQFGLELDPRFLALGGVFGLQIDESEADTYAFSTPQADGSLIIEGRTEFRATLNAVEIASALVPELRLEKKVLSSLRATFWRSPPMTRAVIVDRLAARLAGGLIRLLDQLHVSSVIAHNELPRLAAAVATAILESGSMVGENALPRVPIGVSTWSPVFRFHLMPDGSATFDLTGQHGAFWFPTVKDGDFRNTP
jgi:Tol biopolymer transport system component